MNMYSMFGVAAWFPPGAAKPRSPYRELLLLPRMAEVASWPRLHRTLIVSATLERIRPAGPHWYLRVLGTRPELRRRGLASMLLDSALAWIDPHPVPVYLETANGENLPFCRRHGFEVERELAVPMGGPRLWQLWRTPSGRLATPSGRGT